MPEQYVRPPSFGGKARTDEYYSRVLATIQPLRPMASLSVIARHLNESGFTSPRGLPFDRMKVADFLRNTNL
jgi:hypothetical protein